MDTVSSAPPRRPRRARGWIIALAILLVAALSSLAYLAVQFFDAQDQVAEQQDEIGELNDLLDNKEVFGAAMDELMDTALALDGAQMAELVPFDEYERVAATAWANRRSPAMVAQHTEQIRGYTAELGEILSAAEAEAAKNSTGTTAERVLDEVSDGFARLAYDNADKLCEQDVIGCVTGADPYVVHLDRADLEHPSVDDWGRELVTLHEYAHVLQFTNPEATETALESFGDDWEFMADCYALDAMGSWTLDRRVWTSAYQYWDVSYGYGRVCAASQRKVINQWIDELGVEYRTVSQ